MAWNGSSWHLLTSNYRLEVAMAIDGWLIDICCRNRASLQNRKEHHSRSCNGSRRVVTPKAPVENVISDSYSVASDPSRASLSALRVRAKDVHFVHRNREVKNAFPAASISRHA